MKKISLFIFLVQLTAFVFGQKRVLDHSVPEKWPIIVPRKITNNGQYICYFINSKELGSVLVVQGTENSFRKEIRGVAYDVAFTENSRKIIFKKGGDSLGIMELGKDSIKYIQGVNSFEIPGEGNGEWLAYRLKNKDLVVYDLFTKQEKTYSGVEAYLFSKNGNALIMQITPDLDKDCIVSSYITWLNLKDGKSFVIHHGNKASHFEFDASGSQLVFVGEDDVVRQEGRSLWYYSINMDSAKIIVDSSTSGMGGMEISEGIIDYQQVPFFSKNGDKVFTSIRKSPTEKKKGAVDTIAKVDIWNYSDELLQSQQLAELNANRDFGAAIDLHEKKLICLQGKGDGPISLCKEGNCNYALATSKMDRNEDTRTLPDNRRSDIILISVKDGSRRVLRKNVMSRYLSFSFNGKYVIWYDFEQKEWFTYCIASSTLRNITAKIPVPIYKMDDHPDFPDAFPIGGWLKNDKAVLIYDRFDIWRIGPDGDGSPVNITRGYGRKNSIIFRWVDLKKTSMYQEATVPICENDTLLLSAFSSKTKQSGFFSLPLNGSKEPEKLTMGPYLWYFTPRLSLDRSDDYLPLKAKSADICVLQRMNASTYPNLISTINFRDFTLLTNLAPQKEYNWYTNELLHWHTLDGSTDEGILYKPENFDPRKKYPILFYYYEKNSDNLNLFINPEQSSAIISIPWFVSNGYLVFVPDIKYTPGYPGRSCYNALVSAANYLCQFPWVDSHKMGINGHSFGGFETNYIVSRTDLFAAAAEGAGPSEIISMYGGQLGGESMHIFFEKRQFRLGSKLWQNPELYIENSPIFRADRVKTPLLIMHNEKDPVVPWNTQGAAWFIALQSLGKEVWMLQYDGEGHTIHDPKNRKDFSIRLGQFFDHFLKGSPEPKWMSTGISASEKGIDSGFEIAPN